MLLKSILRLFTLLIILILVVGFFLPTHYKIEKSIQIEATASALNYWLFDLNNWPTWQVFQMLSPDLNFVFGEKTKGVGAFLAWQGPYQTGELTFSKVDERNIQFNVLFNDEHLAFGNLNIEPIMLKSDVTKQLVNWSLEGEIHTPIFAGYLALFHNIVLSSALETGLKNLQAQAEINAPQSTSNLNELTL
ncbi:SRPBCC family protein [Pseudoalteromonas tunicata]|uniref:SRPBCC family protein n=2 Tax=Pseudoalteromonas tunicata TaxID=314281 RepID=UPI00273E6358|nr:SRPBCC family protein [Pseudoalteromonas tunicata]MDP5211754.1 SRPBCC family protein [Pseudoalteromonas tunicata]